MSTLVIDPAQSVSNLQLQFNHLFPFLNLECFSTEHRKGEGSAKSKAFHPQTLLKECMPCYKYGVISVYPNMVVSRLEEFLKIEFGLHVQVFRKSGNVWLETTSTDSWTLHEQNEEGKNSTIMFKEERESADDHDIY